MIEQDNNKRDWTYSPFAREKCSQCAAGWVRKVSGRTLIYCIIDREPVPPEIEACNRWEGVEE